MKGKIVTAALFAALAVPGVAHATPGGYDLTCTDLSVKVVNLTLPAKGTVKVSTGAEVKDVALAPPGGTMTLAHNAAPGTRIHVDAWWRLTATRGGATHFDATVPECPAPPAPPTPPQVVYVPVPGPTVEVPVPGPERVVVRHHRCVAVVTPPTGPRRLPKTPTHVNVWHSKHGGVWRVDHKVVGHGKTLRKQSNRVGRTGHHYGWHHFSLTIKVCGRKVVEHFKVWNEDSLANDLQARARA
jgi:hypothetical protein